MNNKFLGLLTVGLMAGPISANAQPTTYTYQGDALNGGFNISPPAGWTSINVPPILPVGTLSVASEMDPAAAASGLTLLLGAIAVLRGRRKLD
jgi:hypothetical protein